MVWRVLKVLISVQVVMLFTSFLVEINNIEMTTLYMRGIINQSIKSSCVYFSQETYKNDKGDFVGNDVSDLMFSDRDGGGVAVTGKFFEGNTQQDVYNNLYSTNDFKEFLDGAKYNYIGSSETEKTDKQGLWERVDALSKYYAESKGWNIKQKRLNEVCYNRGASWDNTNSTVLNFGVTYMDRETLNNIIRWNMVANFYRGDGESIHKSSYGGDNASLYDYVTFNGFKLYYNTARVDETQYTVYDLATERGMNEFKKVSFTGSGDFWDGDRDSTDQDFRYICVVKITYTMRVGYDGVTYLKPLMKYIFSREARVLGNSDGKRAEDYSQFNIKVDEDNYGYLNTGTDLNYNAEGYPLAPVNNTVYYYVVQ